MVLSRTLRHFSTSAANRAKLDEWLSKLIARVDQEPRTLRPTVAALADMVERTGELRMLAEGMFAQRPAGVLDGHALSPSSRVRNWRHLMALLDAVVGMAPTFDPDGLVGLLPVYSLLNWFMCTPDGARLLIDPRVNAALKPILDDWGAMLTSEASRYVLSEEADGWFGAQARRQMPGFAETFVCEPGAPHHGFRSWDDFFTRRLRSGARPVASPGDGAVIANACEAAPYRVATGVARTDTFWIKDHPYSLGDMLADDALAGEFEGGTVYQGLLSATNYHRWHSPVNGRVVSARVHPGLYYWIEPSASLTLAGAIACQNYMAHLSTRAVIAIEADNPDIGLMCVVPVGLAECSTCEITVRDGARVEKGDELGMFHFGGSTHCLVFRPGVPLEFDLHGETPGPDAGDIPINARIATVISGSA